MKPASSGREQPIRPVVIAGISIAYGLALLSIIGDGPFAGAEHGLIFNDMASKLLEGRFDIDPSVAGTERFERDGRTYSYFGIFPALVRIPFLWALGPRLGDVTALFTLVALALGAAAQAAAVAAAF